jgi:hypothetical protein
MRNPADSGQRTADRRAGGAADEGASGEGTADRREQGHLRPYAVRRPPSPCPLFAVRCPLFVDVLLDKAKQAIEKTSYFCTALHERCGNGSIQESEVP